MDGGLVSIRVTAPVGWRWDVLTPGGFVGHVPGKTCYVCNITTFPEVRICIYIYIYTHTIYVHHIFYV